jgi:osmotically-inducible protein OsmY
LHLYRTDCVPALRYAGQPLSTQVEYREIKAMKKQTMLAVLALAMMFAYASAKAQMGGSQGSMGGQQSPGAQNPNSPNNPANRPDMGPDPNQQQSPQASANTAKVSDADLQTAVKSKLASDPAFANINAAVDNGKVTLDGTVNSKDDMKRAKNVVKSIAGVRGVKEHLTVSGKEGAGSAKPASGPGMAFLSSQDAAQGNASGNTAGSVAGNSQTTANPDSPAPQSNLPEAGSMQQSGASSGGMVTLEKQIETSIKNDPSLTDSSVVVKLSDSAIDLTGTVGSAKAKMNAERIAQSYAQNRKVNDNLQVTGAGNSDLSNGHSAMSNGTTTTPKGNSSQMPQTTPQSQSETTPH